jgi:hypothetical protein
MFSMLTSAGMTGALSTTAIGGGVSSLAGGIWKISSKPDQKDTIKNNNS